MDCFAEFIIGRRYAPTRWLHPGYKYTSCAAYFSFNRYVSWQSVQRSLTAV